MTWILWILAAACVIYYVIIVIYSGFTTSFSFIWLVFAAACLLFALGWEYYGKHKDKVPLWMPVSGVTFGCACLFIFAVVEMMVFTGAARRDPAGLDYLIVLGARVKEDGISSSLKMRLDKAIAYSEENPGTVLVLSGGQGAGEPVSEAEAMRDYLVFNGVDEKQLILETNSASTVENIAYSRIAIEEDQAARKKRQKNSKMVLKPGTYEIVEEKPIKIGVVTSNYHVFRAEQIAGKWGIPDIYGIASESDPILFPHFCVRECVAILKDKLVGNM